MTSNDNLCQDKISNHGSSRSPFGNQQVYFLNKGEEDEMEIYGYKRSTSGTIVTWIFIILSLGILRLVFHWYKHLMLYCTHTKCPLKFAESVLIIDYYLRCHKTYFVRTVRRIHLEKLSLEDAWNACNDADKDTAARLINDIGSLVRIYFNDGSFVDESDLILIQVKKLTYIWREDQKQFSKLGGIEKCLNKSDLHNLIGYSFEQQLLRRIVYGRNEIRIQVQSIAALMFLEFLNPFYIFQVFSLVLWFVELYLYYSFTIIAMSLFGIILTAVQTNQNQNQLHSTVNTEGTVTVCRNIGKSKKDAIYQEIPINDLVPGDIIVIPRTGFIVPCDAVLLSGNCIVNESMLTGESVPVTKTSLPCLNTQYNKQEDFNHTLFCGTQVLQARYYANEDIHAVVLRTGYLTAKGGLIRSILYPVPHDFKFDRDIYKFVWVLGIVAIVGSSYAAFAKIANGNSLFDTIVDALDIITIVVPPALPAAMTVGKYYAQKRLNKQRISCVNPSVITVSGSINCICFDKTGTLTEDGLDLFGVIPVENGELTNLVSEVDVRSADLPNFKEAMATCHSLTLINNVISGDPLDVKMFESTAWILDETELTDTLKYDVLAPSIVKCPIGIDENDEIGIIHQFQFSSNLQRMSVITKKLNSSEFLVYCKGSPEMIKSLCDSQTVPRNLDTVLKKHTEKGYRVIAIGYRTYPVIDIIKLKRLHRDEVECNLSFAGLVIFENKLKPQTIPVISDLKQANMKIMMLTGDNIQTAICVAKECGIVGRNEVVTSIDMPSRNGLANSKFTYRPTITNAHQHQHQHQHQQKYRKASLGSIEMGLKFEKNCKFALTGQTWSTIRDTYPSSIPELLENGVIFARMSSDQKQQVIQELQALDYYVAMCGDGANDCGALRTAHVGISLSEAESSVASPFTSHRPDISCVPIVIREGRAALVTSFGLFKFIILYSLLEFFSTVLLFTFNAALSDFEFLYIDVFLIVVFAFFFGQTNSYHGPLVPQAPLSRLISVIPIVSLLFQVSLMVFVQIFSVILVKQFPWYVSPSLIHSSPSEHANYDNYAVYMVSQFQYIILAITFSVGKPYRQPIYQNIPFTASLIVMTVVSAIIATFPPTFVVHLFELKLPPSHDFRYIVLVLAAVNALCSVFMESFVVNFIMIRFLRRKHHIGHYFCCFGVDGSSGAENTKAPPFSEVSSSSAEHLSENGAKYYGTMDSYNFI